MWGASHLPAAQTIGVRPSIHRVRAARLSLTCAGYHSGPLSCSSHQLSPPASRADAPILRPHATASFAPCAAVVHPFAPFALGPTQPPQLPPAPPQASVPLPPPSPGRPLPTSRQRARPPSVPLPRLWLRPAPPPSASPPRHALPVPSVPPPCDQAANPSWEPRTPLVRASGGAQAHRAPAASSQQ